MKPEGVWSFMYGAAAGLLTHFAKWRPLKRGAKRHIVGRVPRHQRQRPVSEQPTTQLEKAELRRRSRSGAFEVLRTAGLAMDSSKDSGLSRSTCKCTEHSDPGTGLGPFNFSDSMSSDAQP